MEGEGTGSLFLWPALATARKLKGEKKVNKWLYENLHRPLKNVDEKAGAFLERELDAKKLFRQVDVLPTGRRMGRGKHPKLMQHETTSATAPISKAVKFVTPLAATMYAADLLDKQDGGRHMSDNQEKTAAESKDDLLKEAASALDLAQRREDAIKLAFALVEKGKVPVFENYDELMDKVASLLEKDLRVVEAALDMDATMPDFGKVASESSTPSDPSAAFFHRLADE